MPNKDFHQLYSNIKKRIARIHGDVYSSFCVCIAGKIIEIRCYDEEFINFVKNAIKGIIVENQNPSSIIWCLKDDIEKYIPLEYINNNFQDGILLGKDKTGEIQIINKLELSGADYVTNEYFNIRNITKDVATYFYGHPLYTIFSIWAKNNNKFLIHSAAVGKDGEGIILGARSGAGKSTLSVAWMLNGGEIVGDDYVVIDNENGLTASKIYTSVGINSDIEEILNVNLDAFYIMPKRKNKKFYDASKFNFVDSMIIKAIVFPSFDPNRITNPEIKSIPPGKTLTQLIHSTIKQAGENHNIKFVKDLAQVLQNIPTYEILLSCNINENIKCLDTFINNGYKLN